MLVFKSQRERKTDCSHKYLKLYFERVIDIFVSKLIKTVLIILYVPIWLDLDLLHLLTLICTSLLNIQYKKTRMESLLTGSPKALTIFQGSSNIFFGGQTKLISEL